MKPAYLSPGNDVARTVAYIAAHNVAGVSTLVQRHGYDAPASGEEAYLMLVNMLAEGDESTVDLIMSIHPDFEVISDVIRNEYAHFDGKSAEAAVITPYEQIARLLVNPRSRRDVVSLLVRYGHDLPASAPMSEVVQAVSEEVNEGNASFGADLEMLIAERHYSGFDVAGLVGGLAGGIGQVATAFSQKAINRGQAEQNRTNLILSVLDQQKQQSQQKTASSNTLMWLVGGFLALILILGTVVMVLKNKK
ncbi:hypothetical protein SAMN05421823_11956 [Catalinimonas alkaloidigena]|uniref:Uncharacterized protein n=1 Tax=Catalinimonas alkaloidigena TaxID=1075417 RepID=A0A1G9V900_9BACT|nr:hypothetical protein [Catalinimonas alkaloidigena]SDM68682.1 hypothetical protein SAMN05421823_11956 [Catalinimonas alkaloidigena]